MGGRGIESVFVLLLILVLVAIFTSAFSTTSDLSVTGSAISQISTNWNFSGSESVYLQADNITSYPPSNEARINITFDVPVPLIDLENISWQANVVQGYLPHADIFLDNGEVLVFEYAKVDQSNCDNAPYPTGNLSTFDDKGILTNLSYAWLNSGPPGPCGDSTFDNNHKSLADWKINYSGANILKIQIEIDGWIPQYLEHESYVDDVVINGQIVEFFDEVFPTLNSTTISGAYFNGSDYIFSPANQDGFYDFANITMNASELIEDWGRTEIHNSSADQVKFFVGPNNVYSNVEVWKGGFTETIPPFVPDGIYTINTTLTDTGNNTVEIFVGTIFVDNTAPIATLNSPANNSTIFGMTLLNASVSDLSGVQSLVFSVGNMTYPAKFIGGNWINNSFNTSSFLDGFYFINISSIDNVNNANVSTIAQILINNGLPQITNFSPLESQIIIKQNQSQMFNVTAVDFGGDTLIYRWFVNGIQNETNTSSFLYQSQNLGQFNITVIVFDLGNNEVAKEWNLISTIIPIMNSFTGNATTNLSAVADLSNVSDFTLENSAGKITFNDVVDLTNVLDIDGNVIIQNGIIAVNTTKYPELNKNATITLKASYNSVPKILFTSGFTSISSQINQNCDFCEIINYTNFPTANGIVEFEVEHFSSFFVTGSGEIIDLSLLTGLAKCISGVRGNLEIDLNDPEENDEVEVGDFVDIEADVRNNNEQSKDLVLKAVLYNVDKNKEEEKESHDERIKGNEGEEFEFELEIPRDLDENDNYILYMKAYEKNNQESQCNEEAILIDAEREKHNVIIKELTTSPYAYLGDYLNVGVSIENIGTRDEEVYVVVSIPEMEINIVSEVFELEEFDEDDKAFWNVTIKIPENFEQGKYSLNAKVVFDDGFDEVKTEFSAFKKILLSSSDLNHENGETTNNEIQGNNINGEFYKQFDTANKYLVWMNLVVGVLILLIAVFRRR
ncbi:hypothetical protein HYT25_02430 [Candidatus Pacearchaeota archaeon]|nr:hypothetical protein [Candidatus Pacearchaeota archaeon]